MAQSYTCDICNQVPCDFMVTTVNDGEVVAVGIECFEDWATPYIDIARQLKAQAEQEAAGEDEHQGDTEAETEAGTETATEQADKPADGPDAEWEADYPQRGNRGRKSARAAATAAAREDSPPATAADVEG